VRREKIESFGFRPQARIHFEDSLPRRRRRGQGAALLEKLLDRAAVLMAFEQVDAAQRALEITREFTLGRYAFGRPVASFQAIATGWRTCGSPSSWRAPTPTTAPGRWRATSRAPIAPAARVSATDAPSTSPPPRWCRCTAVSVSPGSTTAIFLPPLEAAGPGARQRARVA
jgi:hypothetical protein